jgi:8-oxo-dGTP diphosphatase
MSELFVVGAALVRDERCLVARRSAAMAAPLVWEFPGGKVEPGEAPEDALRRELREELGVEVEVGVELGASTTPVGARTVRLAVYEARLVSGTPAPQEHDAIAWVDADGLTELEWAAPDVPIVPRVAARLRGGSRR